MRKAILILIAVVLGAVSPALVAHPASDRCLVLPYSAFGPQVAAYELIGMEWYQWNNHGSSDPSVHDDVMVVVYRGIPLNEVKKLYPVIKSKQDYRYLEYQRAIDYFDSKKHDALLKDLRKTRKILVRHLGTKYE